MVLFHKNGLLCMRKYIENMSYNYCRNVMLISVHWLETKNETCKNIVDNNFSIHFSLKFPPNYTQAMCLFQIVFLAGMEILIFVIL